MRTKEELLYEMKTVEQIVKNGQRNQSEIFLILAEVFIDIRDLMVDMDKSLDACKESLKDINKSRYRDTGVR